MEEVVIFSKSQTRYDEIIHVMDVTREAGLPLASLSSSDGRMP